MHGTSFDAFARRAVATVSRRASLSALAAAALGALSSPVRVEAGCGKKCNKRCSAQDPYCAAAVANRCIGTSNEGLCITRCGACCFDLRTCEQSGLSAAVTCLMDCVP
jgi:hypothetical protein